MAYVVQMEKTGGAEVLAYLEKDLAAPGEGEVQIRQSVIGVNFVDIYFRLGMYPLPSLPHVLGLEGAGVVVAVGEDVSDFAPGDRVAYAGLPVGGYADFRNLPAGRLVKIPDNVTDRVAGSNMLRGLTAHMLLNKIYPLQPGDYLLVHSAAGGLGQMLARWAKMLGANVIGTVSSEPKIEVAKAAGVDHVILRKNNSWVAQVKELSGGQGVHFAYDGIGADVLHQTMGVVRPFGVLASLGQAGGAIPAVDVHDIRCISLSRPSVIAYSLDPALYRPAAEDLLARLPSGLANPVGAEYALADATQAHEDLEAGRTTGSVVLVP